MDGRRSRCRFGLFEVDLDSGELRKEGTRIRLQEQPFQVLAALLERPREVVARDELQKRLWPGDTVTDFDRGLNKAINRLRDALGDSAGNPRFIETLPQRGYRFLAPVEWISSQSPAASSGPPSPSGQARPRTLRRREWLIAAGAACLAIPAAGFVAYRRLMAPPSRIASVAVLPLQDLSGNPANEYFSDGMTDALIGEIARIGSLSVTSRTSVMSYKGSQKRLPDIARELGVDAIVEGTVVLAGSRVRITANLIRAHDDRHLWSERYEHDLADVLSVQSQVARSIAQQVEIQLTPTVHARLARHRTVKPDAYVAFLKGGYFLHKGISGVPKSIDFFNDAIRLDPEHADSHAGLAQALCYAAIYGFRPSAEALPAARTSAVRALGLDPANAAARAVLAEVIKGFDWNLAAALPEYEMALAANPSHLLSRLWRAETLSRMERFDAALAESTRALALDPVSPMTSNHRAMLLFRARRFDESIRTARHALEFDPLFVNALWWEGMSYAGKRDYANAIAPLARAVDLSNSPMSRAMLGHVYGLAGDKGLALSAVKALTEHARRAYVSPLDFAIVYAGLGDVEQTFRWLEEAYRTRATRIHELPLLYFDGLRSDARFADLMARVGLPVHAHKI